VRSIRLAGKIGLLTGIVDNLLHDTTEVSMALSVIEVSELGRSLVQARVGRCGLLAFRDVLD
jgi:hypothetical protein